MMQTDEQTLPSTRTHPERTIGNENDNVEKLAEKIKQLEALLDERSKRAISDEELAIKMFPRIDPDEVIVQSSDTETEDPSVNSGKDKPFLSKIGNHKSKKNGVILFRCHDTDDENDSWCDADKAVTNVGKKEFRRYVKVNKLKQKTYTPVDVKPIKPVGKKDLKRMANLSKGKANVSTIITKIIGKRRTNDGEKYKVLTEDLRATWKTIDEIGPDFSQLITEYDDPDRRDEESDVPKSNKKKKKEKRKKKSPTKKKAQSKKNDGTVSTKHKQSSKTSENKDSELKAKKDFCCRLNHKKFQSYKAEGDKKWFGENQRFDNSECFICKKNIGIKPKNDNFVPSVAKPAYICVNSTRNCKKCLCHFCCVKLMINDDSDNNNKNRRSTRSRS